MILTRLASRETVSVAIHQFLKNDKRTLIQIAHRKFLPGSDGVDFPKYLKEPRDDFPKVLTWEVKSERDFFKKKVDHEQLGKEIRPLVDDKIVSHPALLLKNLPIVNYEELDTFLVGLGYEYMAYTGGNGARDILSRNVTTVSKEPNACTIELHNEMSYLSRWPKLVLFFCEVASPIDTGGETVIADVRDILRELDQKVVEKINKLQIAYLSNMPDRSSGKAWYNSWQGSLMTDSREKAEEKLANLVTKWKWEQDGSLKTALNMPPFRPHYRTGEQLWFNQLHGHHASYFQCNPGVVNLNISEEDYPFNTTYGDGSYIESEVLQHVRNVTWEASVGWQMGRGDLLILDNMYVQHARLSFTGERKMLTSLVAMDMEYYERNNL